MSYITTNSKIHFDPLEPKKEYIQINDIAHALSYLCRANGHLDRFYSVAQHSINCALEAKARGLSKLNQLACLMHDASEVYISDVTRPVKKLLPEYLEIERNLQYAIYEKFDIYKQDHESISKIDDALLYYEFLYILGEKVFDYEPKLILKPNFSERSFNSVKNEFLEIFFELTTNKKSIKTIGIDGCKGGWMVAVLSDSRLIIERYNTISEVMSVYKTADSYIIDIPIGLPDSKEEADHRPDKEARKILKSKASSLFPVPFRSVARAKITSEAWEVSKSLDAGTSRMTMGIRKAVNEIDVYLQENQEWKNILCESHPEICFAILNNGNPVMEKKIEQRGVEKRLEILSKYNIDTISITEHPLFKKYSDDVVDAVCLALVGKFVVDGKSKTIPSEDNIKTDATGLKMQMIIPKI